jgi:CBS domain-containing protein
MHTRRVGSALVVDGGALVGVFTASDAVRVLASLA